MDLHTHLTTGHVKAADQKCTEYRVRRNQHQLLEVGSSIPGPLGSAAEQADELFVDGGIL